MKKALADWLRNVADSVNRFWFTPADPAPLAAIRILAATVLLTNYLLLAPDLFDLVGPEAWLDARAIDDFRDATLVGEGNAQAARSQWSIYHLSSTTGWAVTAFLMLLASLGLLAAGCFTRLAAVSAWVGHVSFMHRSVMASYGLDFIAGFLLVYLAFGPSGAVFSVDALRRKRAGRPSDAPSVGANVALRCIQVHLCIVYGAAGFAKLQGGSWWSGLAVYYASMAPELWPLGLDFTWLARHETAVLAWANLATGLTLAFEVGFPFLIWRPLWRPVFLLLAVGLHLGVGFVLGLYAFGLIMLTACLSFLEPAAFRQVADKLAHWVAGARVRQSVPPAHPAAMTS